jgi:LysM repeat protein
MTDITINIGLDPSKTPTKPQPMIDGHMSEKPMPKMEQGFDITANPKAYEQWSGKMIDYVVQEGDTLESIAKKYNCKANEIALLNKKNGNMISDTVNVGQKILVPQPENHDIQRNGE